MRHNSMVLDTTHDLSRFTHLTMQAKNAAVERSAKLFSVLIQDSTTVPPMTTKTITAFVNHPSEWHTTGTVTPVEKLTVAASLLMSHSISTIIDKKTAIRITNTAERPYLNKKNSQIAKFSVITPEQSKIIRPVDTAILSMIPEGDLYLTTSLSKLLRTNQPEQQNSTSWFPTRKSWLSSTSYPNTDTKPLRTAWIAREKNWIQKKT